MIILTFLFVVFVFFWAGIVARIVVTRMYEKYGTEQWWGFPLAMSLAFLPIAIAFQIYVEYCK